MLNFSDALRGRLAPIALSHKHVVKLCAWNTYIFDFNTGLVKGTIEYGVVSVHAAVANHARIGMITS